MSSSSISSTRFDVGYGPRRAYVDGCFDIMHSGHYDALRMAAEMCDELVVGVHSSKVVEQTKHCAPVQDDHERMSLIQSCKWVHKVILSESYTPTVELLDEHGCQFAIHGSDVNLDENGKDPFEAIKAAGRFKTVERQEGGISTTQIIDRLLHIRGKKSAEDEDADSYLLTTARLLPFVTKQHRKPGDRVVYVAGSWDLFHSGHVAILMDAAKHGDHLLVGIHEDTAVAHHRGDQYPIMNLFERALNVLSCRATCDIVFDAPYIISELMIKHLHIDVIYIPAQNIDYPDDKTDVYAIPRKLAKQNMKSETSSDKKKDDHKKSDNKDGKKEESIVHIELIESKIAVPLTTDTLIKRVTDNKAKYEERNANKT